MSRGRPNEKPASITSSQFILDGGKPTGLEVSYGSGSYAGQTQRLEFIYYEPAPRNDTTHRRLAQLNGYSDELEVSIRRIIAGHQLRIERYNIQWKEPTEETEYLETHLEKLKKLREASDAVNPQLRMERFPELDDKIKEREQRIDRLATNINSRGPKPQDALTDTMSKIAEVLQQNSLHIKDGSGDICHMPAPDLRLSRAVNLAIDIMTDYGIDLPEGKHDSGINFTRRVKDFRIREHGRWPVGGRQYDHITARQMLRKCASDNSDK